MREKKGRHENRKREREGGQGEQGKMFWRKNMEGIRIGERKTKRK